MPRHLQSLEHYVTTEEGSGVLTCLVPVPPPQPACPRPHEPSQHLLSVLTSSYVLPSSSLLFTSNPAASSHSTSPSFQISPSKETRSKPTLRKSTAKKMQSPPWLVQMLPIPAYQAEGHHLWSTCYVPSTMFYLQTLTLEDPGSSLLTSSCRYKMMLLKRIIPNSYVPGNPLPSTS